MAARNGSTFRTRICSRCKVPKPLEEFAGTGYYCLPCHRDYRREKAAKKRIQAAKRKAVEAATLAAVKGTGDPIWRCECCSRFERRNGESSMVCPNCVTESGSKPLPMAAAYRSQPAPEPHVLNTPFEDL